MAEDTSTDGGEWTPVGLTDRGKAVMAGQAGLDDALELATDPGPSPAEQTAEDEPETEQDPAPPTPDPAPLETADDPSAATRETRES